MLGTLVGSAIGGGLIYDEQQVDDLVKAGRGAAEHRRVVFAPHTPGPVKDDASQVSQPALAVAGAPIILGVVGFTGTGIVAGSIAAKMMSAAAIANGGGVAAGSLVATLQSVGAVGLSTTASTITGAVGAAAVAAESLL